MYGTVLETAEASARRAFVSVDALRRCVLDYASFDQPGHAMLVRVARFAPHWAVDGPARHTREPECQPA